MPSKPAGRQTEKQISMKISRPRILLLLCAGAEHLQKTLEQRARLDCADTLEAARNLWRPRRYDIVLAAFDRDPEESARLCKEIKDRAPEQLLVFLAGHGDNLPTEPCPDAVFPKHESAEYLLARIETFLVVRAQGFLPGVQGRAAALPSRA